MLSVPHFLLRRSVLRKNKYHCKWKIVSVRKSCKEMLLLVTLYSQPRLRSQRAYKFASPTTSSNSAPDTSWFLTCRVRWFPTTHRKTVRLARPVRLVLERYVTLSRTMIKPVLMSRKYLQENEYKSRQNVSNSR